VVKAAENCYGRDATISTNRVAGALAYSVRRSSIGNTWTEARVGPAAIVMRDPLGQDSPEMPLIEGRPYELQNIDHEIEQGTGHHRCAMIPRLNRPGAIAGCPESRSFLGRD
jgi:hypothetical protein